MKNLEVELKSLVAREREILHEILVCIRKIDAERFYLAWGFGSLFEYLTREIGYSPAAAQRRIDAARLSQEIPEVIEQVREGSLTLSQIGEAQKGFRRTKASTEEKREVLEKLGAAPAQEAQRIVAEELQLEVASRPQARAQADGTVRLNITISEKAAADLEKVKAQLSHSIANGDPGELFEKLLAFYLEKQPKSTSGAKQAVGMPIRNRAKRAPRGAVPPPTSAAEAAPSQKSIPRAVRRAIFQRDKCCLFRAPDGRRCGSTYQLQVDHIQMRYHGGTHEPENLRLLCAQHNRYAAEQTMRGEPVD